MACLSCFMIFECLDNFLEWIFDKQSIGFEYKSSGENYLDDIIQEIHFFIPRVKDPFVLRLPTKKQQNKNFLRIIRKSLFEISERVIVGKNIKDFLSFIPGEIKNLTEIYDLDLIRSMTSSSSIQDSKANLFNDLHFLIKNISKEQLWLYNNILKKCIIFYSEMEKNGLPSIANSKYYSYYNLCGTVSGRLTNKTIDKDKFINPLNIVKTERSKIQASFGQCFLNIDYNAMEMRVLSFLCQDPNLQNIFVENYDVYTWICQKIFNSQNISSKQRSVIKNLCFQIIYGGTPFGFSQQHQCSLELAQNIFDRFFKLFPLLETWMLQTKISILENEYIESYLGRRRYLDMEKEEAALRQGINFAVQSFANDITTMGILELSEKISGKGKIIIHDHDACVIECEEGVCEEVANISMEVLKKPQKLMDRGINTLCLLPIIKKDHVWK